MMYYRQSCFKQMVTMVTTVDALQMVTMVTMADALQWNLSP